MLTQLLVKLNRIGMIFYVMLFLLNSFYPFEIFNYLLAALSIFMIFTGLRNMSSFNKYVSVILIFLGTLFLALYNNSFIEYSAALIHNSGIVTLLLAIPLLGIVFHYDDFEKYVINLAVKYMNTELRFYVITSLITSFFGVFINLGSIPFVHHLLSKHSINFPESLMYKAINRGFFSNMLWAPSCIAVAVIIEYFHLSWQEIAPIGFTLAILALILGIVIEKIFSLKYKSNLTLNMTTASFSRKESFKLFGLIFILIASVVILDVVTGKSFLVIMSIISVVLPSVLSIIYKKLDVFKFGLKNYVISLDDKYNEFILFSAIGYFAYALRYTNIGDYITFILHSFGFNSPITLIPLFIFLVLGFSIIGIHPIIIISTVALTIPINQLPISLEQVAFSLLIGYSLYQLVSPFSTAVLVLTSLTQKNPLEISIKINKVFVISFVALSTLLLVMVF